MSKWHPLLEPPSALQPNVLKVTLNLVGVLSSSHSLVMIVLCPKRSTSISGRLYASFSLIVIHHSFQAPVSCSDFSTFLTERLHADGKAALGLVALGITGAERHKRRYDRDMNPILTIVGALHHVTCIIALTRPAVRLRFKGLDDFFDRSYFIA